MSIPRPYHRDLDFHDRANDALVSAAFGDDYEYGLPPVHPLRPRYRPSLTDAVRCALSPASDARSQRITAPAPVASGLLPARDQQLPRSRNA